MVHLIRFSRGTGIARAAGQGGAVSVTDLPATRNAEGRYSITDDCDGCGICASYSSYSFAASADGTRYFLAVQPESGSEEEGIVADALAACPLGCIQDGGPA
jgi:ferredoxin